MLKIVCYYLNNFQECQERLMRPLNRIDLLIKYTLYKFFNVNQKLEL